jgi:hypothetical protein
MLLGETRSVIAARAGLQSDRGLIETRLSTRAQPEPQPEINPAITLQSDVRGATAP